MTMVGLDRQVTTQGSALGWLGASQRTLPCVADDYLIGVTDTAAMIGMSPDYVRRRLAGKELAVFRTKGGHRKFRYSDVIRLVAERGASEPVSRQQVALSLDDQHECIRIAEASTALAFKKYPGLLRDWDEVFSDALLGVTKGLTRPSTEVSWNVSCWNYANWEIIKGIRRRSPVPEKQHDLGVKAEDLAPSRQPAQSLDEMFEVAPDYFRIDNAFDAAIARMDLEHLLDVLSKVERLVLVNTKAHEFLDYEVAAEMGVADHQISRIRARALATLAAVRALNGLS